MPKRYFHRYQCQTLLLFGSQDTWSQWFSIRPFNNKLLVSELVVIDDAGHMATGGRSRKCRKAGTAHMVTGKVRGLWANRTIENMLDLSAVQKAGNSFPLTCEIKDVARMANCYAEDGELYRRVHRTVKWRDATRFWSFYFASSKRNVSCTDEYRNSYIMINGLVVPYRREWCCLPRIKKRRRFEGHGASDMRTFFIGSVFVDGK